MNEKIEANDDDPLKIADMLEQQPAQIKKDDVQEIESNFAGNQPWGACRRSALATLSLSGKELVEAVENDSDTAEAFAQLAVQAAKYSDRLKDFAELMSTASTRIEIALCWREDCQALLERAKAWSEGQPDQLQ